MKLKHKKEMNKLQKGITLIALVITIIVLLILAGVSIATLTGDNEIIGKAKDAKNETIAAQEKELIQIAYASALSQKINNEKVTANNLEGELDQLTGDKEATDVGEATDVEGDIIVKFNETGNQYRVNSKGSIDDYTGELPPTEKEPTTVEEAQKDNTTFEKNTPLNGGEITIPKGFRVSEDSPIDITKGVVVKDEKDNEYVWIPCTIDEYNQAKEEEWNTSYQYLYNGGTWGDSQSTKIGIPSIEEYNGFYIGRYEAGIPSNAPFYPQDINGNKYYKNESTDPTKDTEEYIAVSKKNEPAWSYISPIKAKNVSEKVIKNDEVQSYLIDSHAWDTTCRVMQKYDKQKSLTSSTEWGNYFDNSTTAYESLNTLYAVHQYQAISGVAWTVAEKYNRGQPVAPKGEGKNRLELSTGASEDFKAFNIYDLAGNKWEWTTENGIKSTENSTTKKPIIKNEDVKNAQQATFRGGSSNDEGEAVSVIFTNGDYDLNHCDFSIGFRIVLYLKP